MRCSESGAPSLRAGSQLNASRSLGVPIDITKLGPTPHDRLQIVKRAIAGRRRSRQRTHDAAIGFRSYAGAEDERPRPFRKMSGAGCIRAATFGVKLVTSGLSPLQISSSL